MPADTSAGFGRTTFITPEPRKATASTICRIQATTFIKTPE
jgi:hypothetical protein